MKSPFFMGLRDVLSGFRCTRMWSRSMRLTFLLLEPSGSRLLLRKMPRASTNDSWVRMCGTMPVSLAIPIISRPSVCPSRMLFSTRRMAWSTVSRIRSVCSLNATAVFVFWRISAFRVSFHCQFSMVATAAQAPSRTRALNRHADTGCVSAGLPRQDAAGGVHLMRGARAWCRCSRR